MKAIILAAGLGSRIKPMTDSCPKCLLHIGDTTILERMIFNIQACGINEIIFVLGYCQEQIKKTIQLKFPKLNYQYIINKRYNETNTAFSLMLAKNLIKGSSFIKFDADIVFEKTILEKLIACDDENWLCLDKKIHLDTEEVKVILDQKNKVLKISKSEDPKASSGESIGIEKINKATAKILFSELETMMKDKRNLQNYYESAYSRLIEKNIYFSALDISQLKWIEIDTKTDFTRAERIFGNAITPELAI